MLLSSSIHSRASARQELSSPWRAAGSRARATLPRIPDLRPSGSSRWPSHERVLPLANTLLVLQISVACVLYGSFVLLGHVVRLIVYVEIPQVSFLINQLQIAVASTRNHWENDHRQPTLLPRHLPWKRRNAAHRPLSFPRSQLRGSQDRRNTEVDGWEGQGMKYDHHNG